MVKKKFVDPGIADKFSQQSREPAPMTPVSGSDFQSRVPEARGVQSGVVGNPNAGGPGSEQRAAGNAFVRAREKALSQGANKRDAVAIAMEALQGQSFRQVTTQEAQAVQAQREAIASQVGQVTTPQANITPASPMSVLGEAAPSIGIGAAGGLAGAAGLAGATAASGGTIAAGASIVAAAKIFSSLKEERIQQVKVEKRTAAEAETNLKAIITTVKNGGDPVLGLQLYNEEISRIYQSESNLKLLSTTKFTKAEDELVAIESFRRMQPIYDQYMQEAILRNNDAVFEFPQATIGIENSDINQ